LFSAKEQRIAAIGKNTDAFALERVLA
jgi:hypothetical protein